MKGILKKNDQTQQPTNRKLFGKKKDTLDLETDIDVKLHAPTFWDQISPDGLKINSDSYGTIQQTMGSPKYFAPFYIPRVGYPRKLQTNWPSPIVNGVETDVLYSIQRIAKNDAIRALQKQDTTLKSNLNYQTKRGNTDQIQDILTKIEDGKTLMAEIQFSENDLFEVATTGVIYANSKRELDRTAEALEDEMAGQFIKLSRTFSRIKKGFRSATPLNILEIPDAFRNIDRRGLSTFAPFISGSGKFNGGIPIGLNKLTGQKEFYNAFGTDDFRPPNYNFGIVGIPGSGKSVTAKMLIAREAALMGTFFRIIDIEGEYVTLTKTIGGLNINISEESDIIINPLSLNYTELPLEDESDEELELLEQDDEKELIMIDEVKYVRFVAIKEKIGESLGFFDIVARGKDQEERGLDVFERNFLEEALNHIIRNVLKITSNPNSLFEEKVAQVNGEIIQSRVRKPEPELLQVYKYIIEHYGKNPKAERLIAMLKPFLRTGSKPIFDGQTYLGTNVTGDLTTSRIVNFNISQIEEGFLRPIVYHVMLLYLWEHFAKSTELRKIKKGIVSDELWQLLDIEVTANAFEKYARRIRKRNGSFRWATQDFSRVLESKQGRGILQSTYALFFLEQNRIDLQQVKENFPLSNREIEIIFNNPGIGEGILRINNSPIWLQTDPSDEEMLFLESNSAKREKLLDEKRRKTIMSNNN